MFEKFKLKAERSISIAKITFLIGVLSTFLNNAEAQTNNTEKVDLKHQIELAKDAISKIKVELDEKCKGITQISNGQSVNRYEFPNGQFVEMADNGDYLIMLNKEGTRGFYDHDGDGKLDRAIANDSPEDSDRNTHKTILSMFGDIDYLSKAAEISSAVDPKQVKVFVLEQEKNKVYFADSSDGAHGIIDGENATKIIEKLQSAYTSQLENLVNEEDQKSSESLDWEETNVEKPIEPPIRNKPEKQPEYNPSTKKSDYHATFEDFKKAQDSEFEDYKKAQREKFEELRNKK